MGYIKMKKSSNVLAKSQRFIAQFVVALLLAGLIGGVAEVQKVQAATSILVTDLTSSTSPAVCSLRNALEAIKTNSVVGTCNATGGGPYTLELVAGATYTLTVADNLVTGGPNGLPTIALGGDLTINGNGATIQRGDACPDFRIFYISPGLYTVTINNLTIKNGQAQTGGGMYIRKPTTLNNVTITGNTATTGAGIYNTGSPTTINNSNISGNTANLSSYNYGGGIFNANPGQLIINYSQINNNATVGNGGGIFNDSPNGLSLSNSLISGNTASGPGEGGGVFTQNGTTQLYNSTMDNNAADYGGAIAVAGATTVAIDRSTLSNNRMLGYGFGSAINIANNGNVTLKNSTLTGNKGGYQVLRIYGQPGNTSVLTLNNTTVAYNDPGSPLPFGIEAVGTPTSTPTINLKNSIVYGNGNASTEDVRGSNGYPLTSGGNNVIDTYAVFNPVASDKIAVNPLLGSLSDNGGPLNAAGVANKTMPITSAASPAVNSGGAGCELNDQRGQARIGACDIGAYEFTGSDNTTWVKAQALAGTNISTQQFIVFPNQPKWVKFSPGLNAKMTIKLSGATTNAPLPGIFDISLHKNIAAEYEKLVASSSATVLAANQLPPYELPPYELPPYELPPYELPPYELPPYELQDGRFSPEFINKVFPPLTDAPTGFQPAAYNGAIRSSAIAVAASNNLSPRTIVRNSWSNTGDFYIQIRGRDGATSPTPLTLDITIEGGICSGIPSVDSFFTGPNFGKYVPTDASDSYKTLIITDSSKLDGTAAEVSRVMTKLNTFKGYADVTGLIIDINEKVGGVDKYRRAVTARDLAITNSACPYSKTVYADEIKRIIDSYRNAQTTKNLKYLVLVGPDDVIPFYRYPDLTPKGNEKDYTAPIQALSPAQAAIGNGLLLSQDGYGSTYSVTLSSYNLPVVDMAIGRLVEKPAEILTMLTAYEQSLTPTGAVAPKTSLVTGFTLLLDSAALVKTQLEAGTGLAADTLLTDTWTRADLQPKLTTGPNAKDIIYLSGHFSEGSLEAADKSTLLAQAISNTDPAAVDYTNTLVFGLGCHSGYNVPNREGVVGATDPNKDWAQVAGSRGISWVGGTGYQYADDKIVDYGERLYVEFVTQLRTLQPGQTGNSTVSMGQALQRAKLRYLTTTAAPIGALHEKTVLVATLYGLPMLNVTMIGTPPVVDAQFTNPTPGEVGSGPGAALTPKLRVDEKSFSTSLNLKSVSVTSGAETRLFKYFEGTTGKIASIDRQPILPLELKNVSSLFGVARGAILKAALYDESTTDIFPLVATANTDSTEPRPTAGSTVYYPITPWSFNYFGALAANGGNVQLAVTPAQYISQFQPSGLLSQQVTFRKYNNMTFRVFFSGQTGDEAKVAAPVFSDLKAVAQGGRISFSVKVTSDPKVGIQEVWATYTALAGQPWFGAFNSVQLLPTSDPTVFAGSVALAGNDPSQVRFLLQAVNAVGITAQATNQGALYSLAVLATPPTPPAATNLSFITGSVGEGATVLYQSSPKVGVLLTAGATPLSGQTVKFDFGGQLIQAPTGLDGIARINFAALPQLTLSYQPGGNMAIKAFFEGNSAYLGSSATRNVAVDKRGTAISVLNNPTASPGNPLGINVTLKDLDEQAIPQPRNPLADVGVYVIGTNGSAKYGATERTDENGRAFFGLPNWPGGTYTLCAYYLGNPPLYNDPPNPAFTDLFYKASQSCAVTFSVSIPKATPSISWPTPADIMQGTALDATNQLNAVAVLNLIEIPGTKSYSSVSGPVTGPIGVGTVLPAGTYTLKVDFTPTDTTSYNNASTTVQLVVKAPPVSLISLSPAYAVAGGPAFILTVNGLGFVNGNSKVYWNGSPLTTTFVNATQLTASVPAGLIATPGTASITVVNTGPGGGTTNALIFSIVQEFCAKPIGLLSEYRVVGGPTVGQPDPNALANLTDAFTSTYWSWSNYPKAVAVQVTYPDLRTVSAFKLFTQNPTKAPLVYFQYKDASGKWYDLPGLSNVTDAGASYGAKTYKPTTPVTAKEFRMVVDNVTYLNDIGSFGELQACSISTSNSGVAVGPASGPPATLTSHRLNVAAASASGGDASTVLDGYSWTNWIVSGNPSPATPVTLTLDLGSSKTITGLSYFATGGTGDNKTKVEISDTANFSGPVTTLAVNVNTAGYGAYGLKSIPLSDLTKSGRYIRITISNTSGSWNVGGYGDIQVLGY